MENLVDLRVKRRSSQSDSRCRAEVTGMYGDTAVAQSIESRVCH